MYKYIFVKNVIRSWVSRSVSLWTIRPQRSIRWNGKLETRKPRMLNWNRVEKAMRRWGSGLGKAPVSRPSRKKLLQEVDPRNASEPDQIPCGMPQELHEELTPVLTVLFKNSYKTGSLPAVWKSAWVTPVFKKGTKFDASNCSAPRVWVFFRRLVRQHGPRSKPLDHIYSDQSTSVPHQFHDWSTSVPRPGKPSGDPATASLIIS